MGSQLQEPQFESGLVMVRSRSDRKPLAKKIGNDWIMVSLRILIEAGVRRNWPTVSFSAPKGDALLGDFLPAMFALWRITVNLMGEALCLRLGFETDECVAKDKVFFPKFRIEPGTLISTNLSLHLCIMIKKRLEKLKWRVLHRIERYATISYLVQLFL